MTSSMEQLYQQVILDHARAPHGRGLHVGGSPLYGESFQVNPTCGDEVRLRVELTEDRRIGEVSWQGQGCSISQASLSVLTDLVQGQDEAGVVELAAAFSDLMHSRGEGLDPDREDLLQDATVFTGVGRYPARVKCALLGWMALRDAYAQAIMVEHPGGGSHD